MLNREPPFFSYPSLSKVQAESKLFLGRGRGVQLFLPSHTAVSNAGNFSSSLSFSLAHNGVERARVRSKPLTLPTQFNTGLNIALSMQQMQCLLCLYSALGLLVLIQERNMIMDYSMDYQQHACTLLDAAELPSKSWRHCLQSLHIPYCFFYLQSSVQLVQYLCCYS